MADFNSRGGDDNVYASGWGGGSGMFAMIVLVVIVLWVLFSKDGHRDGGGYPMAYSGGCAPCVQPTFKDESNWEQDYHFCKEINGVDKDVIEQGCKDREAIHCDGDKTREYIAHLQERADDRAYNALAMQVAQQNNTIQTLQLMGDFNGKLAMLGGEIGKGFCKTDHDIERLSCECLKRPPVWGEAVTPNTHDVDRDECRRPRRRRRDFDFDCDCDCD